MRGKTEATLTKNGIAALIGLIACLAFVLGFIACGSGKVKAGQLTVQDLAMIKKIQVMMTQEEKDKLSFQKEANGELVFRISTSEE